MKKPVRAKDVRESSVSVSTPIYTVSVKTWRSGTITLELTPWDLRLLAEAIASAVAERRVSAEREAARFGSIVAESLKGAAT